MTPDGQLKPYFVENEQLLQMHMLKSILHDNFIQGMKTPSVRAIQRVLQEQKSSFECSEVQVNFNLLCTLLGHSVDCRDAKTNSLGLIDLF